MFHSNASLAALCAFLATTAASTLSSSVTNRTRYASKTHSILTTSPPNLQPANELRKRQISNSPQICGYSNRGTDDITRFCGDISATCTGTVLSNGQAYQFCSDPNVVINTYWTTAYNTWASNTPCPSLATCCESPIGGVLTNYFVAGGFTVTGFDCYKHESTQTFTNPNTAVLNPAGFRATLASLASSSSSTSSSSPTPANTSPAKSSPSPSSSDTSGSSTSDGGDGLSSGTKIGIGVGVGVGVGIVLIAAIIFFWWRRHNKKKQEQNMAEIAPSYAHYDQVGTKSPQYPYSPPMSYNQAETQYYEDEPASFVGSYSNAGYPPRELDGEAFAPKG